MIQFMCVLGFYRNLGTASASTSLTDCKKMITLEIKVKMICLNTYCHSPACLYTTTFVVPIDQARFVNITVF